MNTLPSQGSPAAPAESPAHVSSDTAGAADTYTRMNIFEFIGAHPILSAVLGLDLLLIVDLICARAIG